MENKVYKFCNEKIFGLSLVLFSLFTTFLLICGGFFWEGDSTVYAQTNVLLRGLELFACVLLLFLLFCLLYRLVSALDEKKIFIITIAISVVGLVLQIWFVAAAKVGIRYDALKVYDEALALFSQKGILAEDLEGYFARYSNNYAITILTHWLIKIFRFAGIVGKDFSGGVLALQFTNIFFVDSAFVGAYFFIRTFAGSRAGSIFALYTVCNPLSYVWLPFYYTNTVAMPFAVIGGYLLLTAFLKEEKQEKDKRPFYYCVFAGILFAFGAALRATVLIALIAACITLFCLKDKLWERKKSFLLWLFFLIGFIFAQGAYQGAKSHYLAFDERDTAFPITHWIAMGLSNTGSFDPADEEYTMSFPTKEEKEAAAAALIKERAGALGPIGIGKLYMKKLEQTFGDGAGGYHSELNLSKDYGKLWQIVYGVYRDPLLTITQVFYLLSLFCGLVSAILILKKKLMRELFFLPLLLLGSFLFQMIWEMGTVYSIGTMYVNGCMIAMAIPKMAPFVLEKKRRILSGSAAGIGVVGLAALLVQLVRMDYVDVAISVDQFQFQANEYIALSDGMMARQTFVANKEFSIIAFRVRNFEGVYNDSIYKAVLLDETGAILEETEIHANELADFSYFEFHMESLKGTGKYELQITKQQGNNDLIFLYYDTGHYDIYPDGKLYGITEGEMADLNFRVYWREEE